MKKVCFLLLIWSEENYDVTKTIVVSPFMALLRWEWSLSEHSMFKHQNNLITFLQSLGKPWWGRKHLNHSSFICKHWTLYASFSSAHWMLHFLLAQCSNSGVWLSWKCSVILYTTLTFYHHKCGQNQTQCWHWHCWHCPWKRCYFQRSS